MSERRDVLTVKEAAAVARVSTATIRRWCRLGHLHAFQVGRGAAIRIPAARATCPAHADRGRVRMRLLRVTEAAERLAVAASTVYTLIDRGDLPHVRYRPRYPGARRRPAGVRGEGKCRTWTRDDGGSGRTGKAPCTAEAVWVRTASRTCGGWRRSASAVATTAGSCVASARRSRMRRRPWWSCSVPPSPCRRSASSRLAPTSDGGSMRVLPRRSARARCAAIAMPSPTSRPSPTSPSGSCSPRTSNVPWRA